MSPSDLRPWAATGCLLCNAPPTVGHHDDCAGGDPEAVAYLIEKLPDDTTRSWTMAGVRYTAPSAAGGDHRAHAHHDLVPGRPEGEPAVLLRAAGQGGRAEDGRRPVAGEVRLPPAGHHRCARLRLHRRPALPMRLRRPPPRTRTSRPVGRLRAVRAAPAPPAGLAGPVAAGHRHRRGGHRRGRHPQRPGPRRRERHLPHGLVRPVRRQPATADAQTPQPCAHPCHTATPTPIDRTEVAAADTGTRHNGQS
jgi:hypothetical protein